MPKTTIDAAGSPLIRLKGAVQQYLWGRTGSASLAARLAPNAVGPEFKLDEKESYAEVWMGTHKNGPAHLYETPSTSLQSIILTDPARLLGAPVHDKWPDTPQVPFLFKILSIEKALPLQAHPDKSLGERLKKEKPDLAPDANHKPEIAVATGKPLPGEDADISFTGFVGFKPLEEIAANLKDVRELRDAISDRAAVDTFVHSPSREGLKKVYAALLTHGAEGKAKAHVEALAQRVKEGAKAVEGLNETQARLVRKVTEQYPGDVGVFATTFFMNFVTLKRGEAIYIGADEVHAYLEGDIIECMAVSDNVLNSAFAPPEEIKQQVPIFLEMLTYTARPASHWALPVRPYAHSLQRRTSAYDPPLEEFTVLGTSLRPGPGGVGGDGRRERLGAVGGPTIGIVTRGKVRVSAGGDTLELEEGGIVYVVPGNEVQVELLQPDGDGEGEVWWAACVA